MKKGWPTKRLSDLYQIGSSKRVLKSQWKTEGVPFYRGREVTRLAADGFVDNELFISEKHFAELSKEYGVPKAGDIVITAIGTIGNSHVVRDSDRFYFKDASVLWMKRTTEVSSEFVNLWLKSPAFFDQLDRGNGATVDTLTIQKLQSVELAVPPLAEQQRIVGLLGEAFAGLAVAIANAEKNLHNARALFESHLQSVFTQRGPGWVEKRLDELCTFSSGGTPSKGDSSYWQGEIPWVSGRDMKSTQLSDSALHISQAAVDESATRIAQAGTLLILVRGMGLAHGAQIAELLVPCAFNQDIRGIHAKPGLLPRYLLFALRDGINSSDTVLSNAAHGTLKIDSNELQKVMIPFPPLAQQRKIVSAIDALSAETQRLASIYSRKLALLAALKKSLLHQAFTGAL